MNPLWWRRGELLHASVGGAGGERPEICEIEAARRRAEAEGDRDAALEDQRRVRSGYRDRAVAAGRAEIPPDGRPIRKVDLAGLVPSHDPGVAGRRWVTNGKAGRQGRGERDRPAGHVDAVDLMELAGHLVVQLTGVVEDLDPVTGREAQDLVPAEAEDGQLAGRLVKRVRAAGDRGHAGAD